jgi:hypothetical protein
MGMIMRFAKFVMAAGVASSGVVLQTPAHAQTFGQVQAQITLPVSAPFNDSGPYYQVAVASGFTCTINQWSTVQPFYVRFLCVRFPNAVADLWNDCVKLTAANGPYMTSIQQAAGVLSVRSELTSLQLQTCNATSSRAPNLDLITQVTTTPAASQAQAAPDPASAGSGAAGQPQPPMTAQIVPIKPPMGIMKPPKAPPAGAGGGTSGTGASGDGATSYTGVGPTHVEVIFPNSVNEPSGTKYEPVTFDQFTCTVGITGLDSKRYVLDCKKPGSISPDFTAACLRVKATTGPYATRIWQDFPNGTKKATTGELSSCNLGGAPANMSLIKPIQPVMTAQIVPLAAPTGVTAKPTFAGGLRVSVNEGELVDFENGRTSKPSNGNAYDFEVYGWNGHLRWKAREGAAIAGNGLADRPNKQTCTDNMKSSRSTDVLTRAPDNYPFQCFVTVEGALGYIEALSDSDKSHAAEAMVYFFP